MLARIFVLVLAAFALAAPAGARLVADARDDDLPDLHSLRGAAAHAGAFVGTAARRLASVRQLHGKYGGPSKRHLGKARASKLAHLVAAEAKAAAAKKAANRHSKSFHKIHAAFVAAKKALAKYYKKYH